MKIHYFLKLSLLVLLFNGSLYAQSGWFWQNPLPQGNNLRALEFFDANTGIAVGFNGTVIRTVNGGSSWTIINSGSTMDLYALHFLNSSTGFAAGRLGTILRTVNGGLNWSTISSGAGVNLQAIHFVDNNTGIAVG